MNEINKKISLGQYFTKNHFWVKKHIVDFICSTGAEVAFDPYAGGGDLLEVAKSLGFKKIEGCDVDASLNWTFNDSLLSIPKIDKSIIITNPPYLTNYSAKRKKVYKNVEKYFNSCEYDDLYQLAIEKCMESSEFGVMIIPETFINSNFPKDRINSITIIEDLMFKDTENPICVICFDGKNKTKDNIKLYKNDVYLGDLKYFQDMRKVPRKNINIKFNSITGKIALRAVDTTKIENPIKFMRKELINYDLTKIKVSSRLITLIELDVEERLLDSLIEKSNMYLNDFREQTNDILLSPFKGNKKNGERRRRLDYKTARAILEDAYDSIKTPNTLFN